MPLDADAARLAKSKHLATVATLMPDGQPQALLTWVDHDGEHILVNTAPSRQRTRNVRRDPRITVLIHSAEDPGDWAEIRGRVVEMVDGQKAIDHIHELSRRYVGTDYGRPIGPDGRVILVVRPDKVNTPKSLGRRWGAAGSRRLLSQAREDFALLVRVDAVARAALLDGRVAFGLEPAPGVVHRVLHRAADSPAS